MIRAAANQNTRQAVYDMPVLICWSILITACVAVWSALIWLILCWHGEG